jgi:hypothetical protein
MVDADYRTTVHLACNRDERHERPDAFPPQVYRVGDLQGILPRDPLSGGTWIGANNAGLAMTLLNVNSANSSNLRAGHPLSRGEIIPALLRCESLAAAAKAAGELNPAKYAPFRLVLVDREHLAEVRSDGNRLRLVLRLRLTGPVMFTSSGLGDQLVEGPRSKLLKESFTWPENWLAEQEAFHRHQWPDQPQLSVCMRRPEARTVSYTVIRLEDASVSLAYYPGSPDQEVEPLTVTLELVTRRAA